MAWYDDARFYHIYPLGLVDAPKKNEYTTTVHRMKEINPWIDHIKSIGCNAIYIGPLFESVGHGYETTDYKKLDSRLGDNDDLKNFVNECHEKDVKVIFDGVFNHTGRDFFAFKDLQENRENSRYRDWFCNVNFHGNNEYNDGFSYDNWGGYNLLVKLNQRNPEVQEYIEDVIRFWVDEFDVDGIRLDAADVLDFDFMQMLRRVANDVKPDFWLMGEVIHGDYSKWVNDGTLHSVTNYQLHKALYSGHDDHNYYEIAHTVNRLYDMGGRRPDGLKLYNFVDNHDVERLYTKLTNKEHFIPIHILMYTLPGVPSIYYGSEFGIEGKKEQYSDDSLRPALNIEDYKDSIKTNKFTNVISKLGKARSKIPALSHGYFTQVYLTNRQYAFLRSYNNLNIIVAVNNDDNPCGMNIGGALGSNEYIGVLTGEKVQVNNGSIYVNIKGNSGDIFIPNVEGAFKMVNEESEPEVKKQYEERKQEPEKICEEYVPESKQEDRIITIEEAVNNQVTNVEEKPVEQPVDKQTPVAPVLKPVVQEPGPVVGYSEDFENGRIAGLQEAILAIMSKYGPVTDQMKRDVYNQTHIPSLINWVKSFN